MCCNSSIPGRRWDAIMSYSTWQGMMLWQSSGARGLLVSIRHQSMQPDRCLERGCPLTTLSLHRVFLSLSGNRSFDHTHTLRVSDSDRTLAARGHCSFLYIKCIFPLWTKHCFCYLYRILNFHSKYFITEMLSHHLEFWKLTSHRYVLKCGSLKF